MFILLTIRVFQIHLVYGCSLASYIFNFPRIVRHIFRGRFQRSYVRRHVLLIIYHRFRLLLDSTLWFQLLGIDVGWNSFRCGGQVEIVGERHDIQSCGQRIPETGSHHRNLRLNSFWTAQKLVLFCLIIFICKIIL